MRRATVAARLLRNLAGVSAPTATSWHTPLRTLTSSAPNIACPSLRGIPAARWSSTPTTKGGTADELPARPSSEYSAADAIPEFTFDVACEVSLSHVMDIMDELTDKDDEIILDCGYSQGVLTIETNQGTYVVNKQVPWRQLWLSSPLSGPFHYNLIIKTTGEGEEVKNTFVWVDSRDGHPLNEKLRNEFETITGRGFDFLASTKKGQKITP